MEGKTLLIQSKITPEVFRKFALFDTTYQQKRYRRPLLFAANRAYLLPASDRWEEDKLWALISEQTGKRRDLRKH